MCKRILKEQTNDREGIPFYKIGTFGATPDTYIARDLYDEYKSKYPYPKVGEILISASGTIGKAVVYDGRPAYYQDSNIVWVSHNEEVVLNRYLYFVYKTIDWKPTMGGTIARLYNKDLEATLIPVPSLSEQERIVREIEGYEAEIAKAQVVMDSCAERKAELVQKTLY